MSLWIKKKKARIRQSNFVLSHTTSAIFMTPHFLLWWLHQLVET